MGPVERFLQRNSIFHQEIRKMAQTKSRNVPETHYDDIGVLQAEAGHGDGGGGKTLSLRCWRHIVLEDARTAACLQERTPARRVAPEHCSMHVRQVAIAFAYAAAV